MKTRKILFLAYGMEIIFTLIVIGILKIFY
jgi:hypothetical protein